MKENRFNIVKYFTLFLLVALISFLVPSFYVADAVLPSNYTDNYKGKLNPDSSESADYDWYIEDLDIDSVKATVQSWISNKEVYDLSYFEKNPIVVAVIDTGVNYNHEMFLGRYDKYGHSVYLDEDEIGTYDVFYRDEDGEIICYNAYADYKNDKDNIYNVSDDAPDNHGSHVCGIIALLIHELDLEKYIKIMPIKAAYPTKKASSFPAQAVQKATVFAIQNGATVINMSLAGKSTSYSVSSSYAKQAIFVAAAGNEGDKTSLWYPAASSNVIGVMGYNLNDSGNPVFWKNALTGSGSNINKAYDVVAPAKGIISVNGSGNNGYKVLTGTSMASPIVAFSSALALLKYGAIEQCLGLKTTIQEVTTLVKESTTRTIKNGTTTYGVFDLYKLLNADTQAYCKITLDSNNAVQSINDTSIVKLHLTTYPETSSNKGTVSWSVEQDGKIIKSATGFDLEFLPLSKLGDINVEATWSYNNVNYTDSMTITIDYAEFDSTKIKVDTSTIVDTYNDNYILGYPVINKISGLDYVNPEEVSKIMWYIDGKYVGTNGSSYTFNPEQIGEYKISAKLNGSLIYEKVVSFIDSSEVPEEIDSTKTIIIISLSTAAGVLVLAIIITFVVVAINKKKLNKAEVKEESTEGGIKLFENEIEEAYNPSTYEMDSEVIEESEIIEDDEVISSDESIVYEAEAEFEVEAEAIIEEPQEE